MNPNIITGNDRKTSFEYFNADGNLGRQVCRYKVE
jgi:hypothetical protein